MDKIVSMSYFVDGSSKVKLKVKRNGETTIVDPPVKPYFYARKPDVSVVKYYLAKTRTKYDVVDVDLKTVENEDVVRFDVEYPKQVGL
ncbi:MAG: hypothetical protein QXI37_03645, partial [Thermoprotei archaeon]